MWQIIREKGLGEKFTPVPPKLALPIFHYASLEENDELQDLWAHLLASALDPQAEEIRGAYVDIIRQLEPVDVHILRAIYDRYIGVDPTLRTDPTGRSFSALTLKTELNLDWSTLRTALDNLMRTRLITSYVEHQEITTGTELLSETIERHEVSRHHGYSRVALTSLGVFFVRACTNQRMREEPNNAMERTD